MFIYWPANLSFELSYNVIWKRSSHKIEPRIRVCRQYHQYLWLEYDYRLRDGNSFFRVLVILSRRDRALNHLSYVTSLACIDVAHIQRYLTVRSAITRYAVSYESRNSTVLKRHRSIGVLHHLN